MSLIERLRHHRSPTLPLSATSCCCCCCTSLAVKIRVRSTLWTITVYRFIRYNVHVNCFEWSYNCENVFWAQRSTERPTEESLRLDRQIERVTVAANYEMSTMPNNCQPIGLLTYSTYNESHCHTYWRLTQVFSAGVSKKSTTYIAYCDKKWKIIDKNKLFYILKHLLSCLSDISVKKSTQA